MTFACCFTQRSAMLDVTIAVHHFLFIHNRKFQNNVQTCPTVPYVRPYVFMSVPIMSNRAPLPLSLCPHVSTHNVQPCPNPPVFMSSYQYP